MASTLSYPAYLKQESLREWSLVFPDVPEAVFGASTERGAWANAADVLALALVSYPDRSLPFPKPSPLQKTWRMIDVPIIESAKLFIRQAMASQGLSVADLARILKTDHKSARRILSLRHNTRMDYLETVLARLGVRVSLTAA
jgi:antitoxin HicB